MKTTEKEIVVGDLLEAPASVPARLNGVGSLPAIPASSMLEVIERASRDPAVDVDKLERLLALAERQHAAEAKTAYFNAMALLKPELPVIDRKGRIEVREKDAHGKRTGDLVQDTPYARWEDIDAAISPVLTKHGFAITFRAGMAPDGKVTVTGVLSHSAGHSEETTVTLPHDSSGSKNSVQAVGSSLSYGKRYAATFLLNIRTKGEDDDGEEAGREGLTDVQIEHIFDLIKRVGADKDAFCKFLGASDVPSIKPQDYERAIVALNEKGKRAGK